MSTNNVDELIADPSRNAAHQQFLRERIAARKAKRAEFYERLNATLDKIADAGAARKVGGGDHECLNLLLDAQAMLYEVVERMIDETHIGVPSLRVVK